MVWACRWRDEEEEYKREEEAKERKEGCGIVFSRVFMAGAYPLSI